MRVKLLKDLEVGRRNEVIDVTSERGRYLLKVGAALEWKQTADAPSEVTEAEEDKPKVIEKKKPAKKTAGKTAVKTAKK